AHALLKARSAFVALRVDVRGGEGGGEDAGEQERHVAGVCRRAEHTRKTGELARQRGAVDGEPVRGVGNERGRGGGQHTSVIHGDSFRRRSESSGSASKWEPSRRVRGTAAPPARPAAPSARSAGTSGPTRSSRTSA